METRGIEVNIVYIERKDVEDRSVGAPKATGRDRKLPSSLGF